MSNLTSYIIHKQHESFKVQAASCQEVKDQYDPCTIETESAFYKRLFPSRAAV